MSRYLLKISIGAQEFIAAARCARDLWFGSFMLSEISRAAARAVQDAKKNVKKDAKERLIFPCFDGPELNAENFNIISGAANIILAETDDEEDAKAASAAAKQAAEKRWEEFAEEAFGLLRNYVDKNAWEYQKKGVIEFYSAGYPLNEDGPNGYSHAHRNVARLLAARKNLRDFEPWEGKSGVPKSSLDGLRESVLKEHQGPKNIRNPKRIQSLKHIPNIPGARIKPGEALDILGCVKRAAGGRSNFPSVARIAMDPWIRGLFKLCKKESKIRDLIQDLTQDLMECCEKLAASGALLRAETPASPEFPYEGAALLPECYRALEEDSENPEMTRPLTRKLKAVMADLHCRHKPMAPYLAVLIANGDRMKQAIFAKKSPDQHREFSRALSKFAGEARDIVKNSYGSCVYTDGDDVLAFLPVDEALGCARKLHDAFSALPGGDENGPALSVGIAVGHALEDLEDLLRFGREAEKLAKKSYPGRNDGRNGLALTIRAGGNAGFSVREQWKPRFPNPGARPLSELSLDQRLLFWSDCFASGRIPSNFSYELREAAEFYREWEKGSRLDAAMKLDALRIFRRKALNLRAAQTRAEAYVEKAVEGSRESIERLADELTAAQWIGAARAAAGR